MCNVHGKGHPPVNKQTLDIVSATKKTVLVLMWCSYFAMSSHTSTHWRHVGKHSSHAGFVTLCRQEFVTAFSCLRREQFSYRHAYYPQESVMETICTKMLREEGNTNDNAKIHKSTKTKQEPDGEDGPSITTAGL